jgi:hypothetical protein
MPGCERPSIRRERSRKRSTAAVVAALGGEDLDLDGAVAVGVAAEVDAALFAVEKQFGELVAAAGDEGAAEVGGEVEGGVGEGGRDIVLGQRDRVHRPPAGPARILRARVACSYNHGGGRGKGALEGAPRSMPVEGGRDRAGVRAG